MSDNSVISINLLRPGVYIGFDNSQANANALAALPSRSLLIAQRVAGGSIAAGVPVKITGPGQTRKYFGAGSMLSPMGDAFLAISPYVELWAVALDDLGGGTKAVGSITMSGPATAPGTLALYIGGTYVAVGVAIGDSAAALATKVVAAIGALTDLPLTAAVDGVTAAKVNVTANHKGICGNSIDVRLNYNTGDATPTGVAAAIVPLATGTGNPDITTALAAIAAMQFTTITMPYCDSANLTALETELESRWGPTKNNDGSAFIFVPGTWSAVDTLGTSRNNEHVTLLGTQNTPTLCWTAGAIQIAVNESETDPARPLQTLPLPGLLTPASADQYTGDELNDHLLDGVATFTIGAGGVCQVERLVTTYKTNAEGVADTSYRDFETIRTLSALRYTARVRILTKYPRCKCGQDGSVGPNVITPSAVRGEMIALYQDWMTEGWVEGGDALKQFIRDLVVTLDGDTFNIVLPPNLINQLRRVGALIQFRS